MLKCRKARADKSTAGTRNKKQISVSGTKGHGVKQMAPRKDAGIRLGMVHEPFLGTTADGFKFVSPPKRYKPRPVKVAPVIRPGAIPLGDTVGYPSSVNGLFC